MDKGLNTASNHAGQLEPAPCPVCAATVGTDLGAYRSLSPELIGKRKSQCGSCGLVYADRMPSAEEWSRYNSEYFTRAHGRSADTTNARLFRSGIAKIRAAHVWSYLNRHHIEVEAVLEIGPGHGEFVTAFKCLRPSIEYFVVESDASLVGQLQAQGVVVIDDAATLEKSVGLAVISHVLEHTIDPPGFLRSLATALRPGGVLFIEVPCLDFLYKETDEPHLLFFDKPALGRLLLAAGFEGVELTYHGESHRILQKQNGQSRLATLLRKMVRKADYFWPGRHDLLTRPEWSVLKPFEAERVLGGEPARWLRAVAIKRK